MFILEISLTHTGYVTFDILEHFPYFYESAFFLDTDLPFFYSNYIRYF